jgi:hypothetical protein
LQAENSKKELTDRLLLARARQIGAQRVPPVRRSVGRGVANESSRLFRTEESLDVSRGGLDEGGGLGVGVESDDFVSDVVGEDVLVLVKDLDLKERWRRAKSKRRRDGGGRCKRERVKKTKQERVELTKDRDVDSAR